MTERTSSDKRNLNPVSEVLAIIFGFGIAICKTYLACLFIVTEAIVAVVLAIIYGVCHTVLELFRMFRKGRNAKTEKEHIETNIDEDGGYEKGN